MTYACGGAERACGEIIGCSGPVYFVPHCEVLRLAHVLAADCVINFLPTSRIMALSSAKVPALSKLGVREKSPLLRGWFELRLRLLE